MLLIRTQQGPLLSSILPALVVEKSLQSVRLSVIALNPLFQSFLPNKLTSSATHCCHLSLALSTETNANSVIKLGLPSDTTKSSCSTIVDGSAAELRPAISW